ncbi:MAG TPA: lipopolysaccharide heptosyltransferase II [Gemmatimonadaceae bacterium]|nr:lipopolysaccharide heptosyltransferase II [Gemmatimonadaceae bacterium]
MAASLVIQTSFIGDTVLTTPLLAQLANRGPVDVVTTPLSATLLVGHPAVREVIPYDKRGEDAGLRGFLRMARRLRSGSYDIAFLAQGSLRSAALAVVAGIPQRIGFSTSSGSWLYTRRVPYREDLHHAARLLQLARPNGREPSAEELRPTLVPGPAEQLAVDGLLRTHGVAPGDALVALAPGSVWGTKRWPFYPELASELASFAHIVVVGGSEDAPLAAAIHDSVPSAIDATGRLSLLASAELLRRCAILVTNDSAPDHLASAVDTPTVALFGPTVPDFGFGPLASRATVLGLDTLPCRPCDRHGPARCPLGHHRCMRDLAPELVAERVRALLSNREPVA